MSNIYVTEPQTEGKVLLHTSFGDLDVELWPQQAPKACRNFVQLCLEGYYDNTIFHRVIKDFMVQGGDPTGTGRGGESIYGAPFIDEFHSRLKFSHRGLVAMANENKPDSNHSQFFLTLDACEFLNRKHTIFAKITGNTIFNLLSVGDVDTDAQDRPLHPPRLLSAEVLWNPFDDIVPRELKKPSAEEEDAAQKKKRERKATKDRKLLSFGDEEDAFEEEEELKKKKKKKKKVMMSSHDLLTDKKLKAEVDEEIVQKITEVAKENEKNATSHGSGSQEERKKNARASLKAAVAAAAAGKTLDTRVDKPAGEHARVDDEEQVQGKKKRKSESNDERDEYTRLREELKREKKAVPLLLGEKAREQEKAKAAHDMLTPLQQQRMKYLERKKSINRSGRQMDTLKKLERFKATLHVVAQESNGMDVEKESEAYHGQVLEDDDKDDKDGDDAKDKSWMAAKLKFKKHIDDQFRNHTGPTAADYLTIDTRDEKHNGHWRPPRDRSRDRRRERSRSRSRDRSRRY